MKKLYYGFAGLLLTALVVVLIAINLPTRSAEGILTSASPMPTLPVNASPIATRPAAAENAEPEPERIIIPPHTVNGVTASIESYYVDVSHVIFHLRVTGKEFDPSQLGAMDIYDEYGNLINSSGGSGPAMDPELVEFHFEPVTLLKGDRFKGQLAFDVSSGEPNYETLAQFHFDLDLPIYPEVRFFPRQTVSANGMEILVDSVTVTPVFTQVYLCYQPPSNNPWTVGNGTVLKIAGQDAPVYNASQLFSSFTGSYWGTYSEPYWVPPVKNGVCDKIGFQAGTSNPTSLTLTIPDLENILPYLQSPIDLDTLYPGLSKRQAYHAYLEENGYTFKGPWTFKVDLVP